MEAFSIMRQHSPHLAPYIGQLPPAMQHFLRNSNEPALLPYIPSDKISINIHHTYDHWITTVYKPQTRTVYVYDSLRSQNRISRIRNDINMLYGSRLNIQYPMVTLQQGTTDCGAFAIAFAFSILVGIPPETQVYDVNLMRNHLRSVLQSGCLLPFPVSRDSTCLANYFAVQSKMLNKKQYESTNISIRNSGKTASIKSRAEYFMNYMNKRRKNETAYERQKRKYQDKEHKKQ